jgi:hypothetical protein
VGQFLWVGRVLGPLLGALALVKLASQILGVGLFGVPGLVLAAYTTVVAEVQRLLIEVPFHITPPDWAKHVVVLWLLFAGSNWRFLTLAGHGERLLRGVGDVGRGSRRGSMSSPLLYAIFVLLALAGPLFAIFVLIMWLGNQRPGPTGQGRWGDRLMIGNRMYTVRISRLYFVILALAPLTAAALLLWNSVS